MSFSPEPSDSDAEREGEIVHHASRSKIPSSSSPSCGARPALRRRGTRSCRSGFLFTEFLVSGILVSGILVSALLVVSFFLALGSTVAAQAPSLIPTPIDFSRVQALPNHHPQWANAANDAGPLEVDQSMEGLTLVLARPAAQEAAFQQFLADQQNPASANYHHWLTAAEIGERFGPSDADVAAIKGWLQSEGLQVSWVAPSKMFIGFGGTAAGIAGAFKTELHNYRVNGRNLISVSSDPMVPQAVVPTIKAIRGLYTIDEGPQSRARVTQMDSPSINLSGTEHVMGSGDFDTIYDVPNFYTGTGEKIGIVARSRTDAADFTNFQTLMGTTFSNPTEVVPTAFGGVDPGPAYTSPPASGVSIGDQSEATLDVERAGSVAPGAQLLLVVTTQTSGGIEVDAQYLVQTVPTPVQVMSISFGGCESAAGPSGVDFWDSLFQQAAAEGISSFVASGDSGASGCDAAFEAPPASPKPNSPNYICSSSYATCVGGTEFNDPSASTNYWVGPVGLESSAIGYIPEGGWNESWNGTTSTVAASGGGVSSVIATPSWQQGVPGVPAANTGRYTPDVAFSASEHDGYFGCFAAAGGSCVDSNGELYFLVFSGTSAGTPSMAGAAAMLDQSLSAPQGNLNPGLYQLWYGGPSVFHNKALYTNTVTSCDINTPSMCNNSIPGPSGLSGGQAGYEVGTGYDEVIGLGSLDVGNFIFLYPTNSKILTPTVTISGNLTFNTYEPMAMGVTVAGIPDSPVPTGSLAVTIGSYAPAPVTLTTGYTILNIPAGTLAVGNYTVNANYKPDAASAPIYTSASGSGSLTITVPPPVTPTLSLSISLGTFTNSQSISVGVVVNPVQYYPNPTGSVTLTGGGYTSAPVALVNEGATINIPAGSLAVGHYPLTVTYTPDTGSVANYLPASLSVQVQNEGATITPPMNVSPSPLDATTAQAIQFIVGVSGYAGDPTVTGNVAVTSGSFTSAPTSLSNGTATITAPAGTLPLGPNTVTATYTPDAQSSAFYAGASASSTVYVYLAQKFAPTVTVAPITQNPTISQPLSLAVNVSTGTGNPTPTGSVTVSSGDIIGVTQVLANGAATVTLAPGSFSLGVNTITATYYPDQQGLYSFSSTSGTTTVNVTKLTPTVTITPAPSSFSTEQPVQVTVTVSGVLGAPVPSGGVALTAGSYVSSLSLFSGSNSITIPAGSLAPGTDTLSAAYSGDYNYNSATGTSSVTVYVPANAAFTVSGGSLNVAKGFASSNTLTVAVTPTNGFVGTVTLSAAITASPAGAQDLPTMTLAPPSVNLAGLNAANSTLTLTTTASSSAKVVHPPEPWIRWSTAAAPVLTCIALWLVPLRRRLWRNLMLFAGLAVLIAGGVAACGRSGGGTGNGNGNGNGGGNPGTTSGQYTITITGTSGAMTVTNTVTLTVQ
jgi:Pro-kumamolisin, activation domain/Bacterial Ig-like domain (group 3)